MTKWEFLKLVCLKYLIVFRFHQHQNEPVEKKGNFAIARVLTDLSLFLSASVLFSFLGKNLSSSNWNEKTPKTKAWQATKSWRWGCCFTAVFMGSPAFTFNRKLFKNRSAREENVFFINCDLRIATGVSISSHVYLYPLGKTILNFCCCCLRSWKSF